jgi:rhamnosyltransferase
VTGELLAAQTSGSLLPAAVFEKEGLFDESFFIDWVDFDFCLRVKSHGWVIEESTSAVLLHKVAYPKAYNIFGVKVFDTTNYSPVRRYYRTRNVLWMFRRHRKRYFVFCAKMVGAALKDILKIAAEENRWNKLRSAFRGCMDGVCRSMNTAVIQSERT